MANKTSLISYFIITLLKPNLTLFYHFQPNKIANIMKWFLKNLIIKHLGNMKSERNFQLLWVFDGQWCWTPSISKDYMNVFSDTVGMCFTWGSLSTWVCSPWVVEEWSLRYDAFLAFNWWNYMIFSILKGNTGHVILKLNMIQEYRFRLS